MGKVLNQIEVPIEIPNYRFERLLGVGGMARVYLAQQNRPQRQVVIKLVSPDAIQTPDTEIRRRLVDQLRKEGDVAARFHHPNLVTVHECGVIDDYYYLVMEYLPGGDLRERLNRGLIAADAMRITRQIADALAEMHSNGLQHRDLKPENVLFNGRDRPVLADFGIAKETDKVSTLTDLGIRSGTPHYMSPEHATSAPMDGRSDLYSLGVVLFEMLTGNVPFRGNTPLAIGRAHIEDPAPRLPEHLADYQRLLDRLLAKQPDDRFQTADELVAAIDELSEPKDAPGQTSEPTIPFPAASTATTLPPPEAGKRRGIYWIATIAAVGIAAVIFVITLQTDDQRLEPGPESVQPSVVVLPFEALSNHQDDEFFADGLTEELLNALAAVDGLKVAGRTSSFYFKNRSEDLNSIRQTLNVENVLSGSVRRSGRHLRVSTQLIGIADGFPIWSHTYDRELDDIFDVQDDIARNVVAALNRELLDSGPPDGRWATTDPELQQLYLIAKGRLQSGDTNDLLEAERLFDRILSEEPDNHLALTGAYFAQLDLLMKAAHTSWAEYAERGQLMLDRALKIAPDSSNVHAAHALFLAYEIGERSGVVGPFGMRDLVFQRYRIDPNKLQNAEDHARRSVDLDPRSANALATLAFIRTIRSSDSLENILALYDQALSFEPLAREIELRRADTLAAFGHIPESAAAYQTLANLYPDYADIWLTLSLNEIWIHHRLDRVFDYAIRAFKLTHGLDWRSVTVIAPVTRAIGQPRLARRFIGVSEISEWHRRCREWLIAFAESDYSTAFQRSRSLSEESQSYIWLMMAVGDAIQVGEYGWAMAKIESRQPELATLEPQVTWSNVQFIPALAYLRAIANRPDEARKLCRAAVTFLDEQPAPVQELHWGTRLQCQPFLDQIQNALDLLRVVVDGGLYWLWTPDFNTWIDETRILDSLRETGKFESLIQQVKDQHLLHQDAILEIAARQLALDPKALPR